MEIKRDESGRIVGLHATILEAVAVIFILIAMADIIGTTLVSL